MLVVLMLVWRGLVAPAGANLSKNPNELLALTAAKLRRAAHAWHATASAKHGWPTSEKAVVDRGYSAGSEYEQCRFKRRALKKMASGETFNILISGGSVTAGHALCACLSSDTTLRAKLVGKGANTRCDPKVSGYAYRSLPWPTMFAGLLEGCHEFIENGLNEAREVGLNLEADWLLKGLPFAVDTDIQGGYSITGVANQLDSGKLPQLRSGPFRSTSGAHGNPDLMSRYDLVIMDHSANDEQDFRTLGGGDQKNPSAYGSGVNRTFGMVIAQLRALESAPALLFNQFGGIRPTGFFMQDHSDMQKAHLRCFNISSPENKARFVLPATNGDCWSEPKWVASGASFGGENKCHFARDAKHQEWCFDPRARLIEDMTSLPIVEHGVPSISMRDIIWPNVDTIPQSILQLWNGCQHPNGLAHNNMYGLTLTALARMFQEAASNNSTTTSEDGCEALRPRADVPLVPHHRMCPATTKQQIFTATPNRPSANFQPLPLDQASSSERQRPWTYTADRPDKWGWIIDFQRALDGPVIASREPEFGLCFDLTEGSSGLPTATTVAIEFMKSYSVEWGAVNIWFNGGSPSDEDAKSKPLDVIQLESRWERQSSLSRVVVIHAAGYSDREISPFADWTYYLKHVTEFRTIHIEPVFNELRQKARFKFKLSGLRAC
jgi:hypothetical protein